MNEIITAPLMSQWINKEHLEDVKIQEMKATFSKNGYLVVPQFLNHQKALDILNELKNCTSIVTGNNIFSRKSEINLSGKTVFEYRNLLGSNEMIAYLNYLTNLGISKINVFFGSKWQKGDFIGPHSDTDTGAKLGIIIYFSDLEESDGGALNLYKSDFYKSGDQGHYPDQSFELVEKVIPQFNKLAIYEIAENKRHGVGKVEGSTLRYNMICCFG